MKLQYTVLHKFSERMTGGENRPAHSHGTFDTLAEAKGMLPFVQENDTDGDVYILAHTFGTTPWLEVKGKKPTTDEKDLFHGFLHVWYALGNALVECGVIDEQKRHETTMQFLGWHKKLYKAEE